MLNYNVTTDKNGQKTLQTNITGKALMSIPQLNKGTAFSAEERQLFNLEGKLPHQIESLAQQVHRAYHQFKSYNKELNRNIFLNTLLHTNVVLFFRLVKEHVKEMLSVLYTPIVGTAVQTFNQTFLQTRGLYVAYPQMDEIEKILRNRSHKNIQLIVASDGEGVLGIGDQGVGAMDIAIAKLSVYTLFAGINPLNTLPIMLDVGTDNEQLLQDPMYLGWRHPRIRGAEYQAFMDRFVAAAKKEMPGVFMHWEDFGRDTGFSNLHRYRKEILSFNDDLQGTGIVALAALFSALKTTGTPLTQQRIVIFGAGTAGMGVTDSLCQAMIREGLSPEEARSRFYLVDRYGLLTTRSHDATPAQQPYLRNSDEIQDWVLQDPSCISLQETIEFIKPTVLIGCSAQAGAFTESIVKLMADQCERPIIFPLSNPTSRAEATPAEVITWTQNRALIATGSPFNDVEYKGQVIPIPQCNNYLAFPGIGLAVIAIQATEVTDNMLAAASQAISAYTTEHTSMLLPTIADASKVSKAVALAVATTAIADGVTGIKAKNEAEIIALIDAQVWEPDYLPYERID